MRLAERGVLVPSRRAGSRGRTRMRRPVPVGVSGQGIGLRCCCSSRDDEGRSRIGRAVISLDGGAEPRVVRPEPAFSISATRSASMTAGSPARASSTTRSACFILLLGWTRGVSVPVLLLRRLRRER